MIETRAVLEYLQNLQSKIVEALELVDGKNFMQDSWQRPEGGGGTSCILEEGNVFERAGVGARRGMEGRTLEVRFLGHERRADDDVRTEPATSRPHADMGLRGTWLLVCPESGVHADAAAANLPLDASAG